MTEEEKEKPKTRELALRRLSYGEQSSSELQGYLRRKGIDAEEARETVDALVEGGWVDDRRFSAAVARSEAAKGKGPMAVLAKLRRRGVRASLEEARELFKAADPEGDEVSAVRQVLSRRFSNLDRTDRKAVGRAFQALMRRGYSAAAIQAALAWIED